MTLLPVQGLRMITHASSTPEETSTNSVGCRSSFISCYKLLTVMNMESSWAFGTKGCSICSVP